MAQRIYPKVVVRRRSPNQSVRSGSGHPTLIVLHSTESHNRPKSISDLDGVAGWFENPASEVSSHVITDGDGHSARCVRDVAKAWTCGYFNSQSLNIEMIGQAADGPKVWRQERQAQLNETARWIAYWSRKWGIPIQRGKVDPNSGAILKPGVVYHRDLGQLGGGHVDPGVFPIRYTLGKAREYKVLARRRRGR